MQYQDIICRWLDQVSKVDITADSYAPLETRPDRGIASFFSGGVDSFFTLYTHTPDHDANPASQLTHGIFINGFESPLSSDSGYNYALKKYSAMYQSLGMKLVPVRTNLKNLVPGSVISWRFIHGLILASVALLFENSLRRVLVPATNSYYGLHYDSTSNPLTDAAIYTENMELLHDGTWASRTERTASIAEWKPARRHLHVCFERQLDSLANCGKCEKCIVTMTTLKILDQLDRFETFPTPFTRSDIRSWYMPFYVFSKDLPQMLIDEARNQNRSDIAWDLRYVSLKNHILHSGIARSLLNLFRRLGHHFYPIQRILLRLRRKMTN